MTDPTDLDADDVLAAEYVLRLLSPAERAGFQARLPENAKLRQAVQFWEANLAELTAEIPPVLPPKSVRSAVLAAVAPKPAIARGRVWAWITGGLLAAGLTVALLVPIGPPAFDPVLHADLMAENQVLFVQAGYDADTGMLRIIQEAAEPVEGRSMELWLIPEGQEAISLGVLTEDRDVMVKLDPELAVQLQNALLAITDEPLGGAPNGVATGPILAAGPMFDV
ncbi:hypothetical protein BFP70_16055 [Thioclava sp. SK-1]|uniref:anti-sigma factor n=1 Tax=Thioclava sp. SK-1 TaxID=1889770 RepID=UPI0008268ADE|nr:anti-sigma factor [Thioclava sp. SK-1]OCX60979.1 hypothetical protein BFP70_16055 [Thioclava sp. SK-1]